MIEFKGITKKFEVAERREGIAASAIAMFRRKFRTVTALDNLTFSVAPGEMVGLIGPNGAGKSTAVKIMSGILMPDSGECTVMGYVPWKDRVKYVSKIGVVFGHRMQLWWDVPAADSYELLREIYGIDRNSYEKRLKELSEIFDLSSLINMPLRQMSLGGRMRCEIAASLLHSPDILFLDEPTLGLDAVSKLAVRRLIRELNTIYKTTVVLTSHDMDDIEAVTDRVLLIGKGRLFYDGSMNGIMRKYGGTRVVKVRYAERKNPLYIDGAELVSWTDTGAVYKTLQSSDSVGSLISRLNTELALTDITVESEPVENVIASLYRDGL